MLYYFNPILIDLYTITIDNIVIDFNLISSNTFEQLKKLFENLVQVNGAEIVSWSSFKPGTFQNQFSIRLHDGRSFWVGCALNGATTVWGRYRIEANPNKVGDTEVFKETLSFFVNHAYLTKVAIKRFDLAIDIPVPRNNCFLVKDRRMYIERRHGQEWTQYLGSKSSAVGRVKLYNKQVESKLEYPLTRLELTLDPNVPYESINFPKVYYLLADESACSSVRITATEKFILNAVLQGYGSLNDLGRKTRAKIEQLLEHYVKKIVISPEDYEIILRQLMTYID